MGRVVRLKHCGVCDRDLPATSEYFQRNRAQCDGLQTRCKVCSHVRTGRPAGRGSSDDIESQIARELGMSRHDVVATLESALLKLRAHPLAHVLFRNLEG